MGLFDKLFGRTTKSAKNEIMLGQYYSLADLTPIFCGNSGVTLSPLGAAHVENEAYPKIFKLMWEKSNNIHKFLPTLDFSSEAKVFNYMIETCIATETGLKFNYVITVDHVPVGMFIISTPYVNKKSLGYEHWTMDFFVFKDFEGQGAMSIALPRMLLHLKNMGVDDLHLIIDQSNERCLRLINKLPFNEIDNPNWYNSSTGEKPRLFICKLSSIRFQTV